MADDELVATIGRLVAEEHEVRAAAVGAGETDSARLEEIEHTLDQCWDLLRQRGAAREFGGDPDAATVRDPGTVENYLD